MNYIKLIFTVALGLASLNGHAEDLKSADSAKILTRTFGTLVDQNGNIKLPSNFRQDWSHLGSWAVLDSKAPGHGFHDVYTQKEAVDAFRSTGKFPDGTVLVKEVRTVEEGVQTTGQAQWAGSPKIWFVMVKNEKDRFQGNDHWQEGWGWALYEAKNPSNNISKGFRSTCMGCHVPAKQTDWVFTKGYPTLSK